MKVEPRYGKFSYVTKEWVKVKDHNKTSVRSKESKKLVNKSEVATTSYLKMEEIDNKKDKATKKKKKKKSVCCVKFDESLNLTHIYSC